MFFVSNVKDHTDDCIERLGSDLWKIGTDHDNDEGLRITNEVNATLQSDLAKLTKRHADLQKEVAAESKGFFHVKRKRWLARVVTTTAAMSWVLLLISGVWVLVSNEKEKSPVQSKFIIKLISMAITSVMWVMWERYAKALEKQAEFNQNYDDKAAKIQKPQELVQKLSEYEQAINDAAETDDLDPAAMAKLLTEILTIHSQLEFYKERFPPRDRLLAGLIYMLPDDHPIREEYTALHNGVATQGLGGRISAPTKLTVPLSDQSVHTSDDDDDDDDDGSSSTKASRFGVPTFSLPVRLTGTDDDEYELESLANPLFSAAPKLERMTSFGAMGEEQTLIQGGEDQREENYRGFCEKWLHGIPVEYTVKDGQVAYRCGMLKDDNIREQRRQHEDMRNGCVSIDMSKVDSSYVDSLEV